MQELRANTAVKVVCGPFVAVGDGFTPQTSVVLSATADEAQLIKHENATDVDISGNTWAAIDATNARGYYHLTLTASNLDTNGMLSVVFADDSVFLPVRHDYMVIPEAAYDAKYKNSRIAGTATTGSSKTSVVTSAFGLNVGSNDLSGRNIVFLTGDAAGCASDITANTSGTTPTLTITQIATTVASGDTFIVI
jgi:hypothetical protein